MVNYVKDFSTFARTVASDPPDPSHRDAHMLQNFYQTKKEILQQVLPPPLEVPDDPQAYVYHCSWGSPAFGDAYYESAQFVRARYQGREGWYLIANYVESDVALWIGRELFGLPKKIANVRLVREGNRIWGTTTRKGIEIMSVKMEIKAEQAHDNRMESWSLKYSLTTNAELEYAKLISLPYRLVCKESYVGDGSVSYKESDFDPVQQIEVVKPLTCWYIVFDVYRRPASQILEFKPDTLYPYLASRMR